MRLFGFRCKYKCTERLANQSDEIFVRLRSLETKNEQDVFLQSLITNNKVKTHRPRNEGVDAKAAQKVYLDGLKSLYGVNISRIRRLRSLLLTGKSPTDLRGKKLGTNAISDGLMEQTYKLSQVTNQSIDFPKTIGYALGKVPLKEVKLQDINKLLSYVPGEFKEFYKEFMDWPTTNANEVNTGEDEHDFE
ncbi:hypothetical protein J6590_016034 [Homalodisca vitripennis]|nr:hypothetical protein J6590_016034 [Homalodisca vitripennis]